MTSCSACGAFIARNQVECPDCGAPTRQSDKKAMKFDASTERMRQQSQAMLTARYECRKFKLSPQAPGESDHDFIERIDREKTDRMFTPPERIPGSDDDIA